MKKLLKYSPHSHCEERSPKGANDEVPKASRTAGQSAKTE
jgi:hypothetical protein